MLIDMCTQFVEQHEHCTVVTEYNAYGAMTLQSSRGKTYQVVGVKSHRVARQLAALTVDDSTSVSLRQAPGRGNTWRVVAVGNTDPATVPR